MSELFDALVSHQIYLERAKAGEANKSLEIVKPIDERIILILKSLDDGFTRGQLNAALFQIKQLITSGYNSELFPHLERIGKTTTGFEIEFAHSIIAGFLTEETAPKPIASEVFQTVQTRTYQGATMAAWANGLIDDKYQKVQSAVETAVNEGSNFIAPARAAIRNSNNNVKTITRSTISHASNIARAETYELNDESVQVIVWSSILDGRTTITCGVRSNKMYNAKTKEPIEHENDWGGGPGVIHFGCRSIGIPSNREGIIAAGSQKGQAIFTGSKTAIGAESGYERGGNLTNAGKKAKIPSKSNQLEIEVVGAKTSYEGWLRRQPKPFIEDTLGKTKADLFVNDKISLDQFVVPDGRELTVEEIENNIAA